MKANLYNVSRKAAAVAVSVAVIAGSPQAGAVFAASEVSVPMDGSSATELVTGSFTVTEEDLAAMGYGPTVSVPVSIGLAFDGESKGYSGTGEVYAYGTIDSGKSVSVTVDEGHEKYGRVYNASGQDCTRAEPDGFTGTLSKTSWSQADCSANLAAKNGGESVTGTGTLAVAVTRDTFLPRGTGEYRTYIPLVIGMGEV